MKIWSESALGERLKPVDFGYFGIAFATQSQAKRLNWALLTLFLQM